MLFPFQKIRPVQKEFMNDMKYAMENSMNIIANAPTGIGKTAASLSPALEFALENDKTILFLTPRHSQHVIALDTLQKIRKKSSRSFYVSDLIGKKSLCSRDDIKDLTNSQFSEFCKTLRKNNQCSFYSETRNKHNILKPVANQTLQKMKKKFYHSEEAKEFLSKKFCTYEILSELAKNSDVMIGDYYHFFSDVRSSFLTRIKKNTEDLIVIVDEAHNLPDRIRNIASMKINSFILKNAQEEAKEFEFYDEAEIINQIKTALNEATLIKLKNENETIVEKKFIIDLIESYTGNLEKCVNELNSSYEEIKNNEKRSYVHSVVMFLKNWIDTEKGYARIISKNGNTLFNKCLDPSLYSSILNECHSSVVMSGTLIPMKMYSDLFGLKNKITMLKSYKSNFSPEKKLNIIIDDTTTRYSKRTYENFSKIADYVIKCSSLIKGNCAVFFPSYDLRDKIFDISKDRIKKKLFLEKQGSDKVERKKLFDNFVKNSKNGSVLFGVMSGSFSEGADFPGEKLNGVIIVGIPFSPYDIVSKELIKYYDYKFKKGKDYGYIYPALIKCLQAAGRVVRSENDRGVVVFIDERFVWSTYRKIFSNDMNIKITKQPENLIKNFGNN